MGAELFARASWIVKPTSADPSPVPWSAVTATSRPASRIVSSELPVDAIQTDFAPRSRLSRYLQGSTEIQSPSCAISMASEIVSKSASPSQSTVQSGYPVGAAYPVGVPYWTVRAGGGSWPPDWAVRIAGPEQAASRARIIGGPPWDPE